MKCFLIEKNDSDQRLDRFISKAVPMLPINLMYKYIRKKRIKVNDVKSKNDYMLHQGDVVEMYINDEFFQEPDEKTLFMRASDDINVVYEDDNILIINKPVGIISHSDERESIDTLVNRVKSYLYKTKQYDYRNENSFSPALCNRLDRNTFGLVLAAKNANALRIINEKIQMREVKKYYLCVVQGRMENSSNLLTAYCTRSVEDKNKTVVTLSPISKHSTVIKTKYRVINQNEKYSLLEVELITGRQHQIRAHLAFLGHPLLGDVKYGAQVYENKKYTRIPKPKKNTLPMEVVSYQTLCAYKIEFDFFSSAKELTYLNKKEFMLENIWFYDEFMKDKIK